MLRFLTVFAFILLTSFPVLAQTHIIPRPPLRGQMSRMVVFDKRDDLPPVMLSSQNEGLLYLSQLKKKILIINLWATWCPPCVEELPSLSALQTAMGTEKLKIITVSLDTSPPDVVQKYLNDNNLSNLNGYLDVNDDVKKLDALRGVQGIPATLIVDPQGRVLARLEGPADWNGPDARAVMDYYMNNLSFASYKESQ